MGAHLILLESPESNAAGGLRARDNGEIASTAALPKKRRCQLWVVAHHRGRRLASATVEVGVP